MTGLISKIQRYSTRDGPGLRSTVFSMGCSMGCLWCSNPELLKAEKQILYHAERCARCGACVAISGGSIRLGEKGCIIDRTACADLEKCASACYYDAYERIGITITAEELAGKLLRDNAFYKKSGGGVTYSGGEAALQPDFFLETTKILKAESVCVALDTSGYLTWETLEPLVTAVDLVLLDIKLMDEDIHKKYTGVHNRLILDNARKIADLHKEMILRLILVPTVNDSDKEIEDRLQFARSLGSVTHVDILKYHRLGAGKYKSLGLPDPMDDTPECSDELAGKAAKKAMEMGFIVTIGG